jgi:hypothetical protein
MAWSLSRLRLGSMVESLQESLARVAARSDLVCGDSRYANADESIAGVRRL